MPKKNKQIIFQSYNLFLLYQSRNWVFLHVQNKHLQYILTTFWPCWRHLWKCENHDREVKTEAFICLRSTRKAAQVSIIVYFFNIGAEQRPPRPQRCFITWEHIILYMYLRIIIVINCQDRQTISGDCRIFGKSV